MKENSDSIKKEDISLVDLMHELWIERKTIFSVCGIAFLIGVVVAISIPKEYTTQVTMTPETTAKSGYGNLGALANMAGINISGNSGEESLTPELYPEIVHSTPFLLDLFTVEIPSKGNIKGLTLYDYMADHQKQPWWEAITGAPLKGISYLVSTLKDKEKPTEGGKIDPFQLTNDQTTVLRAISSKISVRVDTKTGIIILQVTMQDPLISAMLTDTVMRNLQEYVTNYRTNKAKMDLEYTAKLHTEARKDYYAAQQKYANFADTNRDINRMGYQTQVERLQNEATLAYSLYNQISQQLQLAKAKVQEVTPVFTVIQPAEVSLKASKPNKPIVVAGFIFLGLTGSIIWILVGRTIFRRISNKKKKV